MRETERGSRWEEWRETEKGGWEFSPRRNPRPVRKSLRVRVPTASIVPTLGVVHTHTHHTHTNTHTTRVTTLSWSFSSLTRRTPPARRATRTRRSPRFARHPGPSAARASSYPSASRNLLLTVTTIAPTRRCGRSREDTNSVPSFLSHPTESSSIDEPTSKTPAWRTVEKRKTSVAPSSAAARSVSSYMSPRMNVNGDCLSALGRHATRTSSRTPSSWRVSAT